MSSYVIQVQDHKTAPQEGWVSLHWEYNGNSEWYHVRARGDCSQCAGTGTYALLLPDKDAAAPRKQGTACHCILKRFKRFRYQQQEQKNRSTKTPMLRPATEAVQERHTRLQQEIAGLTEKITRLGQECRLLPRAVIQLEEAASNAREEHSMLNSHLLTKQAALEEQRRQINVELDLVNGQLAKLAIDHERASTAQETAIQKEKASIAPRLAKLNKQILHLDKKRASLDHRLMTLRAWHLDLKNLETLQ